MKEAVLLHIPHASTEIPAEVRAQILLSDEELRREVLTIVDRYTDELFDLPGATRVQSPWCRLVFDPERFRDDKDEPAAAFGRGAIYTRTVHGKPMRDPAPAARDALVRRFYDPYHALLESEVTQILAEHGECLIVDCHSFTSRPLPFEADQVSRRPDLCIGTDPFHTPERLPGILQQLAEARGLSTRRNWPFGGTITPMRYYRKDGR
ncbi:MAG TPA: N-formylglutamate amidohydrolase, partial [Spirochaetia bacterium]|nr:N-formylglutamate amidohydrolase [Spirochaetia bacterium]